MESDADEKPQSLNDPVGREQSIAETPREIINAVANIADSTTSEQQHEYLTGIKLWTLLASVTLVVFLMMLDTSIVGTVCLLLLIVCPLDAFLRVPKAIPRITSDFHSLDDVGWYGSAYLMAR
jgi:hypothetical protein